jgi:hypothetical protein
MRLLIYTVLIVFGIGFGGFVMTNLDSTVDITVGSTRHEGVSTIWVVAASIVVGFVLTGLIAIVEGARTRLENLRLRREMRKMENEINYLRTLPKAPGKPEPDALEVPEPDTGVAARREEADSHVPMAPVYEMDDDDVPPDPDDDLYTGGRAV